MVANVSAHAEYPTDSKGCVDVRAPGIAVDSTVNVVLDSDGSAHAK